jgi:glycosyltransferase involved in cell wall biosynthesis
MRLLYVALDQQVPGTLGGSVHVQAVAEGLARLGHEMHVAAQKEDVGVRPGSDPWRSGSDPGLTPTSFTLHSMSPPFGRQQLRWARRSAVTDLGRRVGAEAIIERYYNFGGEGILSAKRLGIPAVLEVNAPVIDYPGSEKARLDQLLLFEPMRRWRDRICRMTDLFVTPSAAILPPWIDRQRVLEIEWGADVNRFRPGVNGPLPFSRDGTRILCVFAGAFRSWHGVVHLSEALARLNASGDSRFGAVLIGDGPERDAAERAARGVPGVVFTGAIPHDLLPACLAAADIGVAPFDPMKHPPLTLGFYWSPLKIFEYMAAGLPVVAPALPRLGQLVENGREGVLYDPDDPRALDGALAGLADASVRRRLGAAARDRVVREFSWQAHCAALDARLRRLVAA